MKISLIREFKFELFTTRAYGSSKNSNFEADVLEIQLERGKIISISELT